MHFFEKNKTQCIFFNSKITYIVENLENTEHQIQKIACKTFTNTLIIKVQVSLAFLSASLTCM